MGVVVTSGPLVGVVGFVRKGVVADFVVRENEIVVRVGTTAVGFVRIMAWHAGPSKPDLHLHAQSFPATLPTEVPPAPHFAGHGTLAAQVGPVKPNPHVQPQLFCATDPVLLPPF
jgi:hypothetical protein